MLVDYDRIQAILQAEHGYYGGWDIPVRDDERWSLGWMTGLIERQLSAEMRVLDVGCGKGHILMELSSCFHTGLGIDNDPEFLQMAEETKRAEGIQNVDFLLLDYPRDTSQFQPESFDMVISIRGPVPDTAEGIRAAQRLLCSDGMLFCQEIAELHHQESVEIFGDRPCGEETFRKVDETRTLMEQNGFDVRMAADIITKTFFPDIYAWLQSECNIWTWLGIPLPEPDDARITLFAERNTTATGEIETTNHVAWIAGVKQQEA